MASECDKLSQFDNGGEVMETARLCTTRNRCAHECPHIVRFRLKTCCTKMQAPWLMAPTARQCEKPCVRVLRTEAPRQQAVWDSGDSVAKPFPPKKRRLPRAASQERHLLPHCLPKPFPAPGTTHRRWTSSGPECVPPADNQRLAADQRNGGLHREGV